MNKNHSAFDQRSEAGKSIIDALEISAARRPHLEPKPDQEDVRPHSEQEPISDSP